MCALPVRAFRRLESHATQYISMHPAEPDNQAERTERIRLWQEQDHPQRDAFPGDPRGWEKANTSVAELNELGEKLLGARDW